METRCETLFCCRFSVAFWGHFRKWHQKSSFSTGFIRVLHMVIPHVLKHYRTHAFLVFWRGREFKISHIGPPLNSSFFILHFNEEWRMKNEEWRIEGGPIVWLSEVWASKISAFSTGFIRFFDMAECHVRYIYKPNAFLIILEAFLRFWLENHQFETGFIRVLHKPIWLLRNRVFRWV